VRTWWERGCLGALGGWAYRYRMPTHRPGPPEPPPANAPPFDEAQYLYDMVHAGLKARSAGLEPPDMWTQTVTITTALLRVERAIIKAAGEIAGALKNR
jgi:hypothetical protein